MSANPLHPYNYRPVTKSQFENTGHPGIYYKSVAVTSTTVDFTGSDYGAGALILSATTNGTASLSGGGTIDLSLLGANEIYNFSVSQVTEDSGNTVYVLYQSGTN